VSISLPSDLGNNIVSDLILVEKMSRRPCSCYVAQSGLVGGQITMAVATLTCFKCSLEFLTSTLTCFIATDSSKSLNFSLLCKVHKVFRLCQRGMLCSPTVGTQAKSTQSPKCLFWHDIRCERMMPVALVILRVNGSILV